MSELQVLVELSKEINSHKYTLYKSFRKSYQQSSVALILRVKPEYEHILNLDQLNKSLEEAKEKKQCTCHILPKFQQLEEIFEPFFKKSELFGDKQILEVLFLQRAISDKDMHSGQICLPGGKCEKEETDFSACYREVQEEIGVKLGLNDNTLFLGKFPENFFAYKVANGPQIYVTVQLFLIIKPSQIQINLNKGEIQEYSWVPFQKLVQPTKEIIVKKKFTQTSWAKFIPFFLARWRNKLIEHYQYTEMAGLDISMNETLFGLTFFIVLFLSSIVKTSVKRQKRKNPLLKNYNLKPIDYLIAESKKIKIVGLNKYLWGGWLATFFGQRWYKNNRVGQFLYKTNAEKWIDSIIGWILTILGLIVLSFVIVITLIYFTT